MRRALLAAALLASGCSLMVDPSDLEPGAPPVPTGLVAEPGDTQARLYWNALDGDVDHVDVYVGTVSGALALTLQAPGNDSQIDVTGLANDTTYFFAVAAVDSGGTASSRSEEVSTTPFMPDTTPPALGATTPGDGATGVAVDTGIVIPFTEPMDVGSVVVEIVPYAPLGEPQWNEDATQVLFAPTSPLATETAYTVSVDGSDTAGNPLPSNTDFSFSTVPVPPTVESTTPSAGATGIPINTAIAFVFSEPMNKASVQAAFSASPAIACAWSWLGGDTLATCTHVNFAYGTGYTVTLGTGAQDVAGNGLATAKVFSFTTASAPDTTPPTVVTASNSPLNGATGAALSTNISVTFSEPVDKASAQQAFAITSPSGFGGGLFSWSVDGKTMTYDPPSNFTYGTNVSWRVDTLVEDLAGNAKTTTDTFTFRVIRQTTATLYATSTLDGYVWSPSYVNTTYTYFYAGDDSNNTYGRAFVSFDLNGLSSTLTYINDATLYLYQEAVTGTPYGLGNLLAERVDYGSALEYADLTLTPLTRTVFRCVTIPVFSCGWITEADSYTLSTTATIGWKSAAVRTAVNNSWTDRATRGYRSQFRFRFGSTTDSDATADWARYTSGNAAANRPYLLVTYEYP